MNENDRGTPLWLTISIAVCATLLGITAYDYLNKRHERQEVWEIAKRHQQEKDTAAADAVRKERLRRAISAGRTLTAPVAEYYADRNETPPNKEALGLSEDWLPSELLQSIDVRPGGLIIMHFTPESGLQGEVRLQLKDQNGAFLWECNADIADIAEISDGCRYVP